MKLLQKLYRISSPSNNEIEMQRFIISLLKGAGISYTQDKKGNIYATKGESETYPCVVCHMDEVHKVRKEGYKVLETDGVIYGFNAQTMSFEGIGADDKNGIWVCIKALNEFDIIKCAFFVAEEVGCQGSRNADMKFFNDCRFVLQCDRKGKSDFITNASFTELCSDEFIKDANIGLFGYSAANGMMTDVMELKERGLNVSACNISCGYYNPHTNNEMTRISDLQNCYNLVKHIITTCTKVYPHKHEPKVSKYGCYYGGCNYGCKDSWSYSSYTNDTIQQNLKELYPSAWKVNGEYFVYDSDLKMSRKANAEDMAYANNIDTYRELLDYYDDIKFDKDGNPLVKNWKEKKFYSPDEEILKDILGDEEEIMNEYYDMVSVMSDVALHDPSTFTLEEFIDIYGEDYPNLKHEHFEYAYDEVTSMV